MNISFENLSFKVEKRKFCGKSGKQFSIHLFVRLHDALSISDVKEILKGINGEFRGRELSAIIGPSGSGKSTMLNILSGYTPNNFVIKVNQNVASQKTVRWKSSYIMQEYTMHKFLTVRETMTFAMNLKVGRRLSLARRKCKVSSMT